MECRDKGEGGRGGRKRGRGKREERVTWLREDGEKKGEKKGNGKERGGGTRPRRKGKIGVRKRGRERGKRGMRKRRKGKRKDGCRSKGEEGEEEGKGKERGEVQG